MKQTVIPAEIGWFAVYDEGGGISSYPVAAWLWDHDAKKGFAVIVTEIDLISTEDIEGTFLGYQHAVQMPNFGSVPNSLGGIRVYNKRPQP